MKLLHITNPSFTDHHWQAYYALLQILHDRYDSRVARVGWERTRAQFLSLAAKDPNYRRLVAFDDNAAVGWADFAVFAPGTDGQCVSVRVEAADDPASDEFERLIAAEFLRLLEQCGASSAHCMAITEQMSAIARHWFGNELNQIDRFRMRRAEAQISRMKSWIESFPRENPGLRLTFFSPVPEEHLEAYTNLYVSGIREMPTEQESAQPFEMTVEEVRRDIEWRRDNRMPLYTYALFDGGTLIGHSNAVISEDDAGDVYQAMTCVHREYRGRGLSRWLKAALFFKVGEDYPANETMTTIMRSANAPIQKVNAEMGYVHLNTGHEFDITVDGLRRYLKC